MPKISGPVRGQEFGRFQGGSGENQRLAIANMRMAAYNDKDYEVIGYTHASALRSRAMAQKTRTGVVGTYEHPWVHDPRRDTSFTTSTKRRFNKKHSAHAEPRGLHVAQLPWMKEGFSQGSKGAVLRDGDPIAHVK